MKKRKRGREMRESKVEKIGKKDKDEGTEKA